MHIGKDVNKAILSPFFNADTHVDTYVNTYVDTYVHTYVDTYRIKLRSVPAAESSIPPSLTT